MTQPEDETKDRRKDALAVLGIQIQTHERYHTQKENMTWLVTVAYLGATMLLVGREPFWAKWSIEWFECWLILMLVTAYGMLVFMYAQFRARHIASAFFISANDVATQWLTSFPTPDDLQPKSVPELDGMLVFGAVEKHYRKVASGKSSSAQRVALLLILTWSLAAVTYVLSTYVASNSL